MCAEMKPLGGDDVEQDATDAALSRTTKAVPNIVFSCVKMKPLYSVGPGAAGDDRLHDSERERHHRQKTCAPTSTSPGSTPPAPLSPSTSRFYYACLAYVSDEHARRDALRETSGRRPPRSATFDFQRRAASTPRTSWTSCPDIAVTMATMTTNHPWMNLLRSPREIHQVEHPTSRRRCGGRPLRGSFPVCRSDRSTNSSSPSRARQGEEATQSSPRRPWEAPGGPETHRAAAVDLPSPARCQQRTCWHGGDPRGRGGSCCATTRPARRRRSPPRRWGASRCCRRKQLHRLLHPHLRQIHDGARPTAAGGRAQEKTDCRGTDAGARALAQVLQPRGDGDAEFNDRIASDGVGVTVAWRPRRPSSSPTRTTTG
jgi:hypothetical protein